MPHIVETLENHEIGDIACGQEHTLVMSKDGEFVWSFGQGKDYQLGHGTNQTEEVPKLIEELVGQKIKAVYACVNCSFALLKNGRIMSWGHTKLRGIPSRSEEASERLVIPKLIPDLFNIDSMNCGNEHVFALTKSGEIYGWGNNSDFQLGLDGSQLVKVPTLIESPLSIQPNTHFKQVSAGRNHSFFLTISPPQFLNIYDPNTGLIMPSEVPEKYKPVISTLGNEKCLKRLMLLREINQLLQKTNLWTMIDPSSNCVLAYTKLPRQYLFEKTIKLPLMKSIGRTMILGKSHGPLVMVRRLNNGTSDSGPTYSVFEQLANQVVHSTKPSELLLPARAWKVQLIGEGADDAGGVFDDTGCFWKKGKSPKNAQK